MGDDRETYGEVEEHDADARVREDDGVRQAIRQLPEVRIIQESNIARRA